MSTQKTPLAPVCIYFLQKKCTRGSACLYSHQNEPTLARATNLLNSVCVHYQRGSCRFGDRCAQLHNVVDGNAFPKPLTDTSDLCQKDPQTIVPASFTFGPCKFFSQGNCANGTTCPFLHIKSEKNTAAHLNPFATPFKAGKNGIHPNLTLKAGAPVTPQAVKPPCVFFGRGECRNGAQCQFLHTSVKSPSVHVHAPLPESDDMDRLTPATNPYITGSKDGEETSLKKEIHEREQGISVPDATFTERRILNCQVQFGSGASIRRITTSFDSRRVALSNLPRSIDQNELISLVEPFGALSFVTIDNSSSTILPSARMEYAECTEAATAVESLNNKYFRSSKLVARLELRPVESGDGVLLSRKVKVSWYAPSTIAWAHYSTISVARTRATQLDGKFFGGRRISVSFQTPGFRQKRSFSIEIKGLPFGCASNDLKQFCHSSSVTLGTPSYGRKQGIDHVRRLLGPLDAFDVLVADATKTKITAFAQFSSADSAAAAIKNLHGVSQQFLNQSPLWLEQIHSMKYNIPARQFATLVADINDYRDAHQTECKLRYYDRDESGVPVDPVCIRVFGSDPKALGRLKVGLEHLLQGQLLVLEDGQLWDEYFDTKEGDIFVHQINLDSKSFVKLDTRARSVRLFGSESNQNETRGLIIRQLADIHQRRHIVPVERDVLRALLTGGLKALHDSIGAEKILLDVVTRSLTVRGDTDDVNAVRRAVAALKTTSPTSMLSPNSTEAVCPVCFCEATDPIELTCGHIYCTQCLQHFLRSAAGPNFSSLLCIATDQLTDSQNASVDCHKDIPYHIIRSLLSSNEENQLLEAAFLAYIHSHPAEFHYCPTPDCKAVYRPTTKEGTSHQCSACLNRICAVCHTEYHEGLTCAEHRDNLEGGNAAFRRWREENGVKPCPVCKVNLEKNGGCNHMHCTNCRTHICWVCMKTFSDTDSGGGIYPHMARAHGGSNFTF